MTDAEKQAFLDADLETYEDEAEEFAEWANSIEWQDADGNHVTPEFLPEPAEFDLDGDNE